MKDTECNRRKYLRKKIVTLLLILYISNVDSYSLLIYKLLIIHNFLNLILRKNRFLTGFSADEKVTNLRTQIGIL